jgi:pimeloyl-ACP methyl ester carboxylesterase
MNRHVQTAPRTQVRWLVAALAIVVLAALSWGIRWATYARPPLPEALQALEGDDRVEVITEPWLTFTPAQGVPSTGFVFYPGGRIDPRGYAALMKAIAAEGYLVVVPRMPFNIAAFGPNVATKIVAAHPEIRHWAIGGHSVGGAMAAWYTHRHRKEIDGLAIWASYPPDNADLSGLAIPVVSIYGSRETTVTDDSVAERQHLLPPDTRYVRIEGGDHHQFGSYDIDANERRATVDRASQHAQILLHTLDFLEMVSEAN